MKQPPVRFAVLALAVSATFAHAQQATPTPAPVAADAKEAQESKDAKAAREVKEAKEKAAAERIAPVIVTGTRSPKAVDKIAGAITLVSQEEVAHTLAVTEDATAVLARTVPGYAESSQAMSNTGENLRGRIALRLFDGIPQGSPLREGTRNGSFTDMGLIGKIEVINGASASEGMGASGGIINYISKSPTKIGSEFTLVTRYTTQGHDDSGGFKVGGSFEHKQDNYDVLVGASFIDRGMTYDANGRRIGLNTSGSVADSKAENFFVKGRYFFGNDKEQRLTFSASSFKIEGKGNYILVDGDRATGTTNTSERGHPLGTKTEFNDFKQYALSYRHDDLFGGSLAADIYYAKQAMRYPSEDGADRQDPLIAPLGKLIDQSEIFSKKKGVRTSWTRPDAFGIRGFELRAGLDVVQDQTEQRLALTNRLWVPPMVYDSFAPYAQLSYDIGPVTLSGGFRHEKGQLSVDSYTTTYFRNRVAVEGGKLNYGASLPNIGAIWRLPMGWSVFASYGKGFTLPNVGIPLRNVNKPGQSVDGILDLQAVLVDNTEVGFNWRGSMGSFSGSTYRSKSKLGVSLSIDPITNDFVMNRLPVDIQGYELSGELKLSKEWKANALYSHTEGKTWTVTNGPLDRQMGVLDINPDKIGASVTWAPTERTNMTLGATTLLSRSLNVGKSTEQHTKGYTLFDFSANYDFGKFGKATLGVENVTNKFYILSWSQVVGFRNYWAGRGRVVSLSHEIKF